MVNFFSPPKKASAWTTSTLSELNISYEEAATELPVFMALLRSNHTTQTTDEVLANQWKDFMRAWDFTFNFDIRRTGGRPNTPEIEIQRQEKIRDGIQRAERMIEKLQTEVQGIFQGQGIPNNGISLKGAEAPLDTKIEIKKTSFKGAKARMDPKTEIEKTSLGMLCVWKSNLLDFMRYFVDCLRRWDQSHREEKFTFLFMLFSKLCLLRPELGDSYEEALFVNGRKVKGSPDVRFIGCINSDSGQVCKTLAVTEVKLEDKFIKKDKNKSKKKDTKKNDTKKEPFIYTKVADKFLGQHGAELLLEKEKSFFQEGVAGILCIGTRVFFTYLDIDADHFSKIRNKKKLKKTHKAKIYYTEPFDYMDAAERDQILDVLFLFASMQSQQSALMQSQ